MAEQKPKPSDQSKGKEQAKADAASSATLQGYLNERKPNLEKVIPGGLIKADEVIAATILASKSIHTLLKCSLESVFLAVMDCALLGLRPHWGQGGEAVLVPFRKGQGDDYNLTLIIGFQGYVKLFYRSGMVQRVAAHTHHEKDRFRYEETEKGVIYRWSPARGDRGKFLGAFATIHFKPFPDAGMHLEYMDEPEIFKVRDQVLGRIRDDPKEWKYGKTAEQKKADSPWTGWFSEMAKKSAVRRAKKWVPTYEVEEAIRIDDKHAKERGETVDSPGWREEKAPALPEDTRPPTMPYEVQGRREPEPVLREEPLPADDPKESVGSFARTPAAPAGASSPGPVIDADALAEREFEAERAKLVAERARIQAEAAENERRAAEARAAQQPQHPPKGTAEYSAWWMAGIDAAMQEPDPRAALKRWSDIQPADHPDPNQVTTYYVKAKRSLPKPS